MKRTHFAAGRLAAWLCGALVVVGCSSTPDKPKPRPLDPLTPQNVARPAWNQRLANVQFPLTVGVARGALAVGASDGSVLAIEAESGRELWRTNIGGPLSAGVGSDGRFAAVVTLGGELVTVEAGQVKWRKPIGSRVATAPLVAGERVFVLGVDRTVQAFDALDGRKLWTLQRTGDPLTLSQTGVLSTFKDTLIVGQGPRMTGVDPTAGTVRWEVPIGSPRGANEVERLADLVGPALRVDNTLCARSFQAAVGCVDGDRGNRGPDRDDERDRERRNGDHHAPRPEPDRLVAHPIPDQPPAARRPKPKEGKGAGGEEEVGGVEQGRGALVGEVTAPQRVAEHARRKGQDRHE